MEEKRKSENGKNSKEDMMRKMHIETAYQLMDHGLYAASAEAFDEAKSIVGLAGLSMYVERHASRNKKIKDYINNMMKKYIRFR